MLISIKNKNINLINQRGKTLSFELSDDVVLMSIKAFLEKCPQSADFKLSVESNDRRYIIFSNGYKLLINKISFFEIANRMILLNNKLVFPKLNIEDNSEESPTEE